MSDCLREDINEFEKAVPFKKSINDLQRIVDFRTRKGGQSKDLSMSDGQPGKASETAGADTSELLWVLRWLDWRIKEKYWKEQEKKWKAIW